MSYGYDSKEPLVDAYGANFAAAGVQTYVFGVPLGTNTITCAAAAATSTATAATACFNASMIGLTMKIDDFGEAKITAYTSSTVVTIDKPINCAARLFSVPCPVKRAYVEAGPACNAVFYPVYNPVGAEAAALNNWDSWARTDKASPVNERVLVEKISLYSTMAAVYNTDFVVKGWPA